MSFVRGIFEFISHVLAFFTEDDTEILPKDRVIILRSDGTWIVSANKAPKKLTSTSPTSPNLPVFPTSWYSHDQDEVGEILNPPDFFPKKNELRDKLSQCIDAGVISSCTHTRTPNNIYILQVEIPCSDDYEQSCSQFRVFVKVMESTYDFKSVQQERLISRVSNQKIHRVTFEYDPRIKILSNKN